MATAAAVLLSINGSGAAMTARPADPLVPGPVFQGLIPRAPEPCPPAAEPRDLDPVPEEPAPEDGFRRMAVPPPGADPVAPQTAHTADTPPNTSTALDDCVPAATGTPVVPPPSNPMTSPATGEPTPESDQASLPDQPADIDDPDPSGEVPEAVEPAPTVGPAPTVEPEPTGEPLPSASPTPTVTPSAPRVGKPGSAGVGDGYFPAAGNGGYDVKNYDVALGYKAGRVDATVAIAGQATQDLSAFTLDYRGPRVLGIVVNGQPATYRRRGQELVITPPEALLRGQAFTAVVRYSGEPGPVRNSSLGTYGWVPTRDGAITVSEPDGTPTWLPVNDHPQDKATYVFRITVPNSLQVLANGEPAPPVRKGATTTYTWMERSPMASYLAMVAIGKFQVRRGKAGKIPVITAVDPKFKSAAKQLQGTTIAALKWQSKLFGPYPFATSGGIIDDPKLDYALETQERPVYAGFAPDDDFIVHELAHQWFGNSVSLRRWPDIWLNEGFATYAEWLWQEHRTAKAKKKNRDSAKKIFKRYYQQPSSSPIFNPPPGKPGRHDLFSFSVYIRGAMCLQALRQRVGDKAFFRTLRAWTTQRRHGNAITSDFITLAEKQSGKQLNKLFNAWLYSKGKPKKW